MKDHDSVQPGPGRSVVDAVDAAYSADLADRDSVSDSWGRAAAYDAYADGLHTYALGGLRNHEAAASAVYCAFVAADYHVAHLSDAEVLRPWLYAITRHYCRQGKLPRLGLTPGAGGTRDLADSWDKQGVMAGLERSLLVAELASLDWPDTDGMQTAHREVLELSVRHGLESRAVGLMLARPADESFELLAQAWTELERSLAATALLRTTREHCAQLAALASEWTGRLTSRTREPLVAHVDACSHCQYYLHTVIGTPQAPTILPHVAAPSALRDRVLGDLVDTSPAKAAAKAGIAGRLAEFDRLGFPRVAPIVGRPAGRPGEGGGARAAVPGHAGPESAQAGQAGGLERRTRRSAADPASGRGPEERRAAAGAADVAAGGADLRRSRWAGEYAAYGVGDDAAAASERRRAWRTAADAAFDPDADDLAAASSRRRPRTLANQASGRSGAATAATPRGAEGRRSQRSATAADSAAASNRRGRLMALSSAAPAAEAAGSSRRPAPGRPSRHRKSALRTLGGSAVLSGAGAAGVTAFLLLVPSSPDHTTLFTHDPDAPGGSAQAPDAPLPTSGQPGAPIPVASGPGRAGAQSGSAGQVSAQIVAAVVTTAPAMDSPAHPAPGAAQSGHLNVAVDQRANNPDAVTVTLWNSGAGPVAWTAAADAPYLRLSSASGVLQPGTQQSVTVTVDQAAAPATAWQAHVRFDPGGSTVVVHGTGTTPVPPPTSASGSESKPPTSPGPTSSPSPTTTPPTSTASPSSPSPTSSPSSPTSTPSPTASATPSTAPTATSTAPGSAHASDPSAAPTSSPAATPQSGATDGAPSQNPSATRQP